MNRKYTKEILEPIVSSSGSWAEVCRQVGVVPATGAQSHIKKVASKFSLDSSHFLGQGWSKGKTYHRRNTSEYLVNPSFINSDKLRKRLIAEGIKEKACERCGLNYWFNDDEVPLELDHINSDHFDCRLENLRILCANCHYQVTNNNRRSRIPIGRETVLRTPQV